VLSGRSASCESWLASARLAVPVKIPVVLVARLTWSTDEEAPGARPEAAMVPLPENGAPPALMPPTSPSLSAVTAAPFCTVTPLVCIGSPI
jgi:hypothetical protein